MTDNTKNNLESGISPVPNILNKNNKVFPGMEELTKHKKEEKIKNFIARAPSSRIRLFSCILQIRNFEFEDEKTKEKVMGLTVVCTNGNIENDAKLKGLPISEYSLKGKEFFNLFNQIKTPPFGAVLEFKMNNKRNTLEGIWSSTQILELPNSYFEQTNEEEE